MRAGGKAGAAAFLAAILAFGVPVSSEASDAVTIAILGDSLTQGFGLPAEDGLVARTQAYLDGQGAGVTLVNAGVSGDTTAGGLARVAWTLAPGIDGVVVILGGNDFLRGIDPEVSAANLDGIVQATSAAGVGVALAALPSPTNFGADYKARFDAIHAAIADRYDLMLLPDLFAPIRGDGGAADLLAYMQADGIHPSAIGVNAIVDDAFGAFVAGFARALRAEGD